MRLKPTGKWMRTIINIPSTRTAVRKASVVEVSEEEAKFLIDNNYANPIPYEVIQEQQTSNPTKQESNLPSEEDNTLELQLTNDTTEVESQAEIELEPETQEQPPEITEIEVDEETWQFLALEYINSNESKHISDNITYIGEKAASELKAKTIETWDELSSKLSQRQINSLKEYVLKTV